MPVLLRTFELNVPTMTSKRTPMEQPRLSRVELTELGPTLAKNVDVSNFYVLHDIFQFRTPGKYVGE